MQFICAVIVQCVSGKKTNLVNKMFFFHYQKNACHTISYFVKTNLSYNFIAKENAYLI